MSINLLLCSAGFGEIIIIAMLYLVFKKKINFKFALVWIILFVVLILTLVIPGFLSWLTDLLGFQTPSNMILSIFIAVLIAINISYAIAMSRQTKRITKLIQDYALLKSKIDKLEKK